MKVTKDMIDPQLRVMVPGLNMMLRGKRTVEDVRRSSANPGLMDRLVPLLAPKPKGIHTEERSIPRPDGSPMRIIIRRPPEPRHDVPGILHIHGGGYHMGSPELQFHCKPFIDMSGAVMVSPAYRLSVDEPYPAALDDCYTALLWLKENAASLGVRDDQLAVTGESAGGGLTAALTLYARDKGEVNIAFQMPLFPMIDDRNSSDSARDNDAPGWDAVTNEVGWKLYLGDLWGTDEVPAYAAPARATDYTSLPPTYTYVGSIDPFRSETETYIARLRAAGVPAELHVHDGAYHGFDGVRWAKVTKRAHALLYEWFEKAVEEYTAPQES